MAIRLVAYDLNREEMRPNITAAIKKHYLWARLSDSAYAIDTAETPQQVYDRLHPLLDGNDHLYVITLNRPYFGLGPRDVNAWLSARLP
jgi:hypothetical protein